MRTLALGLAYLIVTALILRAQPGPGERPAWEDIRKLQPDGLQLKMTLPKDHFYQGEVIKAVLDFSNTSTAPYHLWIGNYDRSGRIPDIAVLGQDNAGQSVPDPLAWYFMMGSFGGGLGNEQNLSTWSLTQTADQWLRFDHPGAYTLYAWSNRVQKGSYDPAKPRSEAVTLVSDKVQITIDPLTPDREKQIIADAQEKIALGGEFLAPAVEQLRYLQTPAARAVLLPLLANDRAQFDATMGLCAAPNPAADATGILAAVRQGSLPLHGNIGPLYARMKTYDLFSKFVTTKPTPEAAQQISAQYAAAMKQAQDEITAAALQASGGKGDAYLEVLMTKFQQNSHDPSIRADLVQHQLELSDKQAEGVLESWDYVGGDEFLPLARKMVGEPTYSLAALMALVKSKPDEAQALMMADAQLPKSNLFTNRRGSFQYDRLHLAPMPQPGLDSALRAKLASGLDVETTFFYIDQFGSPALLPDVIARYQPHEGKWACEPQKFLLRYWLRCDPKAGLDTLSRALQARASTGCYKNLLGDVLSDRWDPAALPLLAQSLDDPSDDVVLSAIKVLEAHADSTYIDKTVAALERLNGPPATGSPTPGVMAQARPTFMARQLLESKNWHFSPDQQKRLEAVAGGH